MNPKSFLWLLTPGPHTTLNPKGACDLGITSTVIGMLSTEVAITATGTGQAAMIALSSSLRVGSSLSVFCRHKTTSYLFSRLGGRRRSFSRSDEK